ncbi:MAG TPA: hypothetical protein VFU02_21910 [Polyangiaceae bacterium]|nr:hypothetical protein [Polyangiaceae bacterium]
MRSSTPMLRLGGAASTAAALLTIVNACAKPEKATPPSPASSSTVSANSVSAPALASAAGAASQTAALPPPTPTGNIAASASYLVSLNADDCPVALRINDVPLREVEAGRHTNVGEIVDPWIRTGINSVSLEAKGKLAKACATVEILAIPPGGDQRTAPRVLAAKWPAADSTSGIGVFEFHGPAADRCQLWRDAQSFELSAPNRSELLEQVRVLQQLFSRRDVTGLAERTDYRARDIARCMGKSPESGVEDQKRFFSNIMPDSGFVATPLDEAALFMDVVGDGKFVWLHRRDGKLLLENSLGQGMDLYAAKIAGRWTIVR